MIAAATGIPILFAYSLFVFTASSLSSSNNFAVSPLLPFVSSLSIIPVNDTPSSLSSSQLFFHIADTYLKFVRVDCIVPSIVASLTFSSSVSLVSLSRTTTSDRLQNSLSLRIISEQGFVPKLWSAFLLPFFAASFCAESRLNIPLSPDLES